MSKQETIVRTIAQVIGGVAVFRLIHLLWDIEIAETHVGRAHSAVYNVCSADLTVPVLHGAIIEGVATWVCRIGSRSASNIGFGIGFTCLKEDTRFLYSFECWSCY